MTTLTIHADDYLADAIRVAASNAGSSINVFLKDLISSALGVSGTRRTPSFMNVTHRLTDGGAKELLSAQAAFSQVDEELWK